MKKNSILLFFTLLAIETFAYIPMGSHGKPADLKNLKKTNSFLQECAQSKSQTDLKVNNVRARLQGGGDLWWDFKGDVGYIVPNVPSGVPAVSAIFAAGLWMGGIDAGGNMKTACAMFRGATDNDWWPGPLDEMGMIEAQECANWDKHFEVYKAEIQAFKEAYNKANKDADGKVTDTNFGIKIPKNIKGWPAKGNPFFQAVHGFSINSNIKRLASYYDLNTDGIYNPFYGDYPELEVHSQSNCVEQPDQMVFWIFNDTGGIHTQSNGQPMKMEVHATSYAYITNDELNNASFLYYRTINRASQSLDSVFFSLWVDPDLGCYSDDYIGVDTKPNYLEDKRAMMYVYNQDEIDGSSGTTCGGINTYGNKTPILGIEQINNLYDLNIGEIKKSFMYFINNPVAGQNPATADPISVVDHYRYMNCVWKDGTPLSVGGNGYNQNPDPIKLTKYAFGDDPTNPNGWSMANANLPFSDMRTLLNNGPFQLIPGSIRALAFAVSWVPNQGAGKKADLSAIRQASLKAREKFNRCFWLRGPDAPEMKAIEQDKSIVLTLFNNNTATNNYLESYGKETPFAFLLGSKDTFYKFEGYKIYQIADENVSIANDKNDLTKARLVAQFDLKNGIKKIYNWTATADPLDPSFPAYNPILSANGNDTGIAHSLEVSTDAFTQGANNQLVNGKKYHFVAIAYAYNNFKNFDKKTGLGQQTPYLEGSQYVKNITAIPKGITNATAWKYGDEFPITRYDGVGVGGHFLSLTDESRETLLLPNFDGTLQYQAGKSPVKVKVYDPSKVQKGEYELTLFDSNMQNDLIDADAKWRFRKIGDNEIIADKTIEQLNEQLLQKYGLSVTIQQQNLSKCETKFALGGDIQYKKTNAPKWLAGIRDEDDNFGNSAAFDFALTDENDELGEFCHLKELTTDYFDGQFYPYSMCDYKRRTIGIPPQSVAYTTPTWFNNLSKNYYLNAGGAATKLPNTILEKLNNVDIVLTSDKSKWSRCIVVETINDTYTEAGLAAEVSLSNPSKAKVNFDLRAGKSVGSDSNPDGNWDGTYGKSWFPGYAVNVETGQRVNIFFGENSGMDEANGDLKSLLTLKDKLTGKDMIWNPSQDVFAKNKIDTTFSAANLVAGGGHYIYVTDQTYDACADLYTQLTKSSPSKTNVVRRITWTSMPYLAEGTKLLSYKDGIIPNDALIQLRVNTPYKVLKGVGTNKNYPSYSFSIGAKSSVSIENTLQNTDKQHITVYPNPFFKMQHDRIYLNSIPQNAEISIFSVSGQLIFQQKNKSTQDVVELNLKNQLSQMPTGMYFINIKNGEKQNTVKWLMME